MCVSCRALIALLSMLDVLCVFVCMFHVGVCIYVYVVCIVVYCVCMCCVLSCMRVYMCVVVRIYMYVCVFVCMSMFLQRRRSVTPFLDSRTACKHDIVVSRLF